MQIQWPIRSLFLGENNMYNSEYYLENEIIVSKQEALREILNHGIEDASDFFEECGIKDEYKASDVLIWLGY